METATAHPTKELPKTKVTNLWRIFAERRMYVKDGRNCGWCVHCRRDGLAGYTCTEPGTPRNPSESARTRPIPIIQNARIHASQCLLFEADPWYTSDENFKFTFGPGYRSFLA